MADREKVLKALAMCANDEPCYKQKFRDCPYSPIGKPSGYNCAGAMARDALELLKAQEPVAPISVPLAGFAYTIAKCAVCGTWLRINDKFCPGCGRAVKRDE